MPRIIKCLPLAILSILLFTACSKKDKKDNKPDKSGAEITATLKFSSGEEVDYAFTHKSDDLIQPYLYGPNENDHYKLLLRGERKIDGFIYIINIYATLPENGVGDYGFGIAWQWHDKGLATEIHVGVQEVEDLYNLKTYTSSDADNTDSKGLTISSLTENHVKGSFSGNVARTETDTIKIQNGKFDIDIKRGSWED